MRLDKIKLSGFKSFVDPTLVQFPSNRVGIVGPNGCGKSNIIDAVRWVMGESSAKHLRGESLADVIFNGSTSRKPVGTATIEMVFDNGDGSVGGQYAQYSEISVKRQLSRDGQSSYFLNGVRCRRRDITDLFLGTGLGPRSYAIIEQGMISRLIEARPEELRIYLEEAAGISKYKERRRETETRMAHTRENLDRLNDLREEIAKQLQHLQRQAKTAERYQVLKQEERRLKAELMALRWSGLDTNLRERDRVITERETVLEGIIARQRRVETEIEQYRIQHEETHERFNEVQGRYYAVGAEIARLEQAIQHARELRQQQQEDLVQLEQAWTQAQRHCADDQTRLKQLAEQLAHEEPSLAEAKQVQEQARQRRGAAEAAMHEWQTEWEGFNTRAAQPAQTAQVERTRINQLEQQIERLTQRMGRMGSEAEGLDDGGLGDEIARLEHDDAAAEAQTRDQKDALEAIRADIASIRDANSRLTADLDQVRAGAQAATGRRASLEALQQAALGKQQDVVTSWLEDRGLARAQRLAQGLDVESGWQRAVETVLGFHLQAVCVDGLDMLGRQLESLGDGALTLFDTAAAADSPPASDTAPSLLSRVRSAWRLAPLLNGVLTAEHLGEAMAMRGRLQSHESVVTRDGIWLGRNWLRVSRQVDEMET